MKNLHYKMFLLLLLHYSCTDHRIDEPKKSELTYGDTQNELKKKVLAGDTTAYYQLRQFYMSNDNPTDFLFWAMIMANKYKFKSAYYDAFFCIQEVNTYYKTYAKDNRVLNILDSTTDELSKSYLLRLSDTNLINKSLRSYNSD